MKWKTTSDVDSVGKKIRKIMGGEWGSDWQRVVGRCVSFIAMHKKRIYGLNYNCVA